MNAILMFDLSEIPDIMRGEYDIAGWDKEEERGTGMQDYILQLEQASND